MELRGVRKFGKMCVGFRAEQQYGICLVDIIAAIPTQGQMIWVRRIG